MVNYLWAFLALACAYTQAELKEPGMEYVNKLGQIASSHKSLIVRMAANVTAEIQNHYETHSNALNRTVESQANIMNERAADFSCHPSLMSAVALISDDTFHDWQDCVRISEAVLDVGWVVYNFTKEIRTVEDTICNGIKNMSHCNQTKAYDKIECVSGAIESMAVFFVTKTNGVMYYFEKLNEAIENAVSRIAHCFGLASLRLLEDIPQLMEEKCPDPVKLR